MGEKKPNPWGLHDMLGNVMEYVADSEPPKPGHEWARLGRAHGVLKGGSWADGVEAFRPPARCLEDFEWNRRHPEPRSICRHYDGPFVGFRVARSSE